VSFQLSDVSKLIPEFLLILGAVFVLVGDLFGRWRKGPEGYAEQANEAATMTMFILGFAFVVTLIQGGFLLHRLPFDLTTVPFIGSLITNLRASGRPADPYRPADLPGRGGGDGGADPHPAAEQQPGRVLRPDPVLDPGHDFDDQRQRADHDLPGR
jgi:hypothetical protein